MYQHPNSIIVNKLQDIHKHILEFLEANDLNLTEKTFRAIWGATVALQEATEELLIGEKKQNEKPNN